MPSGAAGAVVDPVGEGLHPLDRAGAVAVEAAVHRPLEAAAQRVERERRGHRGHRRAGGRAAAEGLGDEERERRRPPAASTTVSATHAIVRLMTRLTSYRPWRSIATTTAATRPAIRRRRTGWR